MGNVGFTTHGKPEPYTVALAVAAMAHLGMEDDDLLEVLVKAVIPKLSSAHGPGSHPALISIASRDELLDMQHGFGACQSERAQVAHKSIVDELHRRSYEESSKQKVV